jgi:hypothetical protein
MGLAGATRRTHQLVPQSPRRIGELARQLLHGGFGVVYMRRHRFKYAER